MPTCPKHQELVDLGADGKCWKCIAEESATCSHGKLKPRPPWAKPNKSVLNSVSKLPMPEKRKIPLIEQALIRIMENQITIMTVMRKTIAGELFEAAKRKEYESWIYGDVGKTGYAIKDLEKGE